MVYIKDTNNLLNILNKYTFQYPKINLMKNTYFLHLYKELKNIYNNLFEALCAPEIFLTSCVFERRG